MTKQCAAPGCGEQAGTFSTHCERHKQAQRRHGHPLQAGITGQALQPYLERVEARRKRNKDSNAWTLIDDQWATLRAHAESVQEQWAVGHAMNGMEVRACALLQAMAGAVAASAVSDVNLAMWLMRDAEPRRFRSDKAFDFQLARRTLALAPRAAGSYWSQKEGRLRKVYREVPPKVTEMLGRMMRDAYGLAGLALAAKERAEATRAEEKTRAMVEAIEALA